MIENKYHFFLTFLIGLGLIFLGIFALVNSSSFIYIIVVVLGSIIIFNALYNLVQLLQGKKQNLVQLLISIAFGCLFIFVPKLPMSLVVIIFALYICITGVSQFITYYYYKKEKVSGRIAFLVSSLVLLFVAISFLLSPYIHAADMTRICAVYMIYIGLKYVGRSMRELLSENRKNSLKRRVRVSLPIFLEALFPRLVLENINHHLEVDDKVIYQSHTTSPIEVLVHVSKDGFGAIGHVDICYDNKVIAYGAYDDHSNHFMGAMGDGVLFEVNKDVYIPFCLKDDPTSGIFGYTLYVDEYQKEKVLETIQQFKVGLIEWFPPCFEDKKANDYASRLYQNTKALFYKFKKGQFKHYFVMTTNCVLLADRIVGKSGIDIVNMNGIITPGTYYSYLEEESKKENSRVLEKHIYINE